jgi:hypothetical protein
MSFGDRPWRWGGGAGFGGGRGWRHRYWATGRPGWQHAGWWPGQEAPGEWSAETPDNELQALEHEAAALEHELERVRARLHELNETEKHST